MAISIFSLFAFALCVTSVVLLGGDRTLRRRVRHPRRIQAVAAVTAAVLVPANAYCASMPLGSTGQLFSFLVEVATIAALCGLAVLYFSLRIGLTPAAHPRRVLVLGAHPDDLELGCGGTMAKLADSGHEIHAIVMTNGEQGGDNARRPGEAGRGGRFIGATTLELLAFRDTRLDEHELEMVQAIEGAVLRFDPDIVLTHSANDQHQDHQAVHRATLRAARQHPSILCYESPSATPAFRPSVFVDIGDYVDVKTTAVGAHRDQRAKPYMTPERVRGLAVYRGSQARIRHAEGYEPVRLLGSPMSEL